MGGQQVCSGEMRGGRAVLPSQGPWPRFPGVPRFAIVLGSSLVPGELGQWVTIIGGEPHTSKIAGEDRMRRRKS